ncbi:MAG: hypothetical protein HQK70_15670, partial [Desulfamplus sp.]|nr:hypothetical protein [Desulfamplus sp.]
SQFFNIYPAYDKETAAYNTERDGQLMLTKIMTPAQCFYNLAMLPGWQKWKPLYRYARITAKSGNLATINIEDIRSTQQNLNINYIKTMANVPIEYMSCNGGAFDIGDDVLVRFEAGLYSTATIIGFKEEPKGCGIVVEIHYKNGNKNKLCLFYNITKNQVEELINPQDTSQILQQPFDYSMITSVYEANSLKSAEINTIRFERFINGIKEYLEEKDESNYSTTTYWYSDEKCVSNDCGRYYCKKNLYRTEDSQDNTTNTTTIKHTNNLSSYGYPIDDYVYLDEKNKSYVFEEYWMASGVSYNIVKNCAPLVPPYIPYVGHQIIKQSCDSDNIVRFGCGNITTAEMLYSEMNKTWHTDFYHEEVKTLSPDQTEIIIEIIEDVSGWSYQVDYIDVLGITHFVSANNKETASFSKPNSIYLDSEKSKAVTTIDDNSFILFESFENFVTVNGVIKEVERVQQLHWNVGEAEQETFTVNNLTTLTTIDLINLFNLSSNAVSGIEKYFQMQQIYR